MLETLKKSGVTNTVVVVTRYFGGVKLGASGLIRAYSHAVTLGLQAANIADYKPYDIADVTVSYSFVSTLERMTPSFDILVADRAFSDTVTFTLQIPQERTEAFKAALIDTTNGTAHFTDKGSRTIPIIRPKTRSNSEYYLALLRVFSCVFPYFLYPVAKSTTFSSASPARKRRRLAAAMRTMLSCVACKWYPPDT